MESQRVVIYHDCEYGVWKIDALLFIMVGNTGYGKSTLCYSSCLVLQSMENRHFARYHT